LKPCSDENVFHEDTPNQLERCNNPVTTRPAGDT
jgi:hypothetical protein